MRGRETLQNASINTLWEATRITVRHEVEDPNGYFEDARENLTDGDSLLVIINHFDTLDTTIVGHVIEQNVSPLERTAGVTALKYLDPNRSSITSKLIEATSQVKGFSVIPVIQDKEDEISHYEDNPDALDGKSTKRFNREAMKDAIRYLRIPGNVLMMAPEGTRSKDRKLLKAHEGLDSIMRMSKRTALVLPIALVPPDTRRIVPPYTKIHVRPGEVFSMEDIQQEDEAARKAGDVQDLTLTDRMMLRIARNLPPRNQGYYRKFINQDTSV